MKTEPVSQPFNLKFYQQLFIFSLLGFVGNYLNLSVNYNVDFIFGSIFTLVALRLLGWPGIVTAFIASSYTYLLWHHPYAIFIFTAEAAFIVLALQRGWKNLLVLDVIYWLCIGMPLVALFYAGVMSLGFQVAMVVALKQALNGIFNALIASLALSYLPLRSWLKLAGEKEPQTLFSAIFHTIAAAFMFTVIVAIGILGQSDLERTHQNAIQVLKHESRTVNAILARWFDYRVKAISSLVNSHSDFSLISSESNQAKLEQFLHIFSGFHNVYLADREGTTRAYYPPVNAKGQPTIGLNFSDRDYYKKLKQIKTTVVSNVFMGRGGTNLPIFAISVPILEQGEFVGFGLGAVDLDKMREFMQTVISNPEMHYTLVDSDNKVVISTVPERVIFQPLADLRDGATVQPHGSVFLRVPGVHTNISIMSKWQGAAYMTEQPIGTTGWTLVLEYPLAPLQQSAYAASIIRLNYMAVLFIAAILLSWWLSRIITTTPQQLVRISQDLPKKIAGKQTILWPDSQVFEFRQLIDNFKSSAEALAQRIEVAEKNSHMLEEQVIERTSELTASEQRFRNLFHEHAAVFLLIDPHTGRITAANKSAAEFYGYSIDELKSLTMADINTLSAHEVAHKVKEAATDKEHHFIFNHRLKSGEVRTVETYSTLIDSGDNSVLFSVIHDISERQKAEDSLRLERTHLRTLVNTMPDLVWLKDPHGHYLSCNHRFEQLFGASQSEIVGKTDYDFVADDLADFFREHDRKALLAETSVINEEVVPFASDGHVEHLETIKTPLRDEDGSLIGILGLARDITDRKQKESSLLELKKEAEALSEERGLLLKEINHRVKNNLALIVGMLNLEASKRNSDLCNKHIADIVNRVNALSTVHSLLSANQWQPVNIRDLCQQIIGNTLTHNRHPQIQINHTDLTIEASQAHNMSLIVNELATNTAKYTPGIEPLIVSIQIEATENNLSFVYQDNGPGYPAAIMEQDSFGSGIGIQMMNGIVTMSLGGEIHFSNAGGARTEIVFPLASDKRKV